jgi:hypothetical protein
VADVSSSKNMALKADSENPVILKNLLKTYGWQHGDMTADKNRGDLP